MICEGCGNEHAWAVRVVYDDGRKEESCDRCQNFRPSGSPDIYWNGPHSIEHVTDSNGTPIHFESKAHKARVFKEQHLREAGDRINGARSLPFHKHKRYQRKMDPGKTEAI